MGEICVVLLAAGNSSRYGGIKLLAPVDGVALVRRAALAALDAGAATVVVTGAYADRIAAELDGLALRLAHNDAWQDGMGGSIATAFRDLAAAAASPAAAIVCLADQPRVGASQLRRLIDAHRAAPGRIVASDLGGTLGPPCLFPRRYFPELARLSGPHGARALLARHAGEVDAIAMPEAAVDIDTPEDHARLLAAARGTP